MPTSDRQDNTYLSPPPPLSWGVAFRPCMVMWACSQQCLQASCKLAHEQVLGMRRHAAGAGVCGVLCAQGGLQHCPVPLYI